MANIIKIKRSTSVATPAALSQGELAYSEADGAATGSGNLFIGTANGLVKIGGNTDVQTLAGLAMFKTITVDDTDTEYTWSATGSVVADTNADTLTLVSGTGANIDIDATLDAVKVGLLYAGAGTNFIDAATAATVAAADTIIFHDATDDTVKKGLVSSLPFTNNVGTVTSVSGGTGIASTGGATPSLSLTVDELAEKTGDVVGTDRLVGTTGTTNWAETIGNIPLSAFNNDLSLSSGTVTSVTAGNGMTQTGTSTINPTLNVVSHAGTGGSIGTLTVGADSIGVDLGTTSTTAAAGNHTHSGYLTALTAGTLIDISGTTNITVDVDLSEATEAIYAPATDYVLFLDGGATGTAAKESGADFATSLAGVGLAATSGVIALDFSELTDMTADVAAGTEFILQDAGVESRKAASEIKLSVFNNDILLDSDTMTGATAANVPSAESVVAYVGTQIASALSSEMSYKGAFDPTAAAGAGSPDLDSITSAIGDTYTVTVAGTYNWTTGSAILEVGDVLIAEAAGVLNDVASWTVINKNLNDSAALLQNLWATFTADSGTATANATTDSFDFNGGTGITTAISGDILTITNSAPHVATDLSVGTVTATNVPILSSTGTDISTLPAATATLAGIITNGAQTFGGTKTFFGLAGSEAAVASVINNFTIDCGTFT